MKEYIKPDVEIVSLVANEAITDVEAEPGVESIVW